MSVVILWKECGEIMGILCLCFQLSFPPCRGTSTSPDWFSCLCFPQVLSTRSSQGSSAHEQKTPQVRPPTSHTPFRYSFLYSSWLQQSPPSSHNFSSKIVAALVAHQTLEDTPQANFVGPGKDYFLAAATVGGKSKNGDLSPRRPKL